MVWGFSNNHTHLQKYKGDYYLFYHNMCLQEHKGTNGGFRSLCVNKLKVDEKNVKLEMGEATLKGVDQIKPVNPFIHQQAETTAATLGIHFEPTATPGNMLAVGSEQKKISYIRTWRILLRLSLSIPCHSSRTRHSGSAP